MKKVLAVSMLLLITGFLFPLYSQAQAPEERCCVCDIKSILDKTDPGETVVKGAPQNGGCEVYEEVISDGYGGGYQTKCGLPNKGSCDQYKSAQNKQEAKEAATAAADAYKKQFVVPQLQVGIPGLDDFGLPTEVQVGEHKYYFVTWLGEYLGGIYRFAVGAGAVLAVIVIMVGGFLWLTSAGNQTAIGAAKSYIFGAIIGLVILLSSYLILKIVSPALVNLQPIRLAKIGFEALDEISIEPQRVNVSNVSWSGQNITDYDNVLKTYANQYGLDCNKLKAHMIAESGGQANAVSPAGACGLIQLLPSTAGLSCEQLKDPVANINAAANYYKKIQSNPCPNNAKDKSGQAHQCLTAQSGCNTSDERYTIAAYNGGTGANCHSQSCPGKTWWECQVNSGYQETRNYVDKVQSIYKTLSEKGWGC